MTMQELFKTRFYVDFATAGQDAFTRVALLADFMGGM
jgi:hypothetical protein